jgi:hypothetical protein
VQVRAALRMRSTVLHADTTIRFRRERARTRYT